MPTKTKAKKRVAIMPKSELSDHDKADITDWLGYDPQGARDVIEKLDFALAFAVVRIKRLNNQPQAPHVRAELKPIRDAALKLAALISQEQLTEYANICLPPILPQMREQLRELAAGADATIRLHSGSSGGDGGWLRQARKQLIEQELLPSLISIFEAHAIDPIAGDRDAFINLCRSKLS